MKTIASVLVDSQWRTIREARFEPIDIGGKTIDALVGVDSTLAEVAYPVSKIEGLRYKHQPHDVPQIYRYEVD